VASFTSIAPEYYDKIRHPTCANFEELSRLFLEPILATMLPTVGYVVELGAGRSVVAPLWGRGSRPSARLILVDNSPEMLNYSREWLSDRVEALIADASKTELPDRAADIVVSSLGDPYNTIEVWIEVERILSNRGTCLFTTPTKEWANLFRPADEVERAEFKLRDGRRVYVPSLIPSREDQRKMFEAAGLRVLDESAFGINCIRGEVSPKISKVARNQELPAVRGYRIVRA
jgi:SAM-dependent methyltransferase